MRAAINALRRAWLRMESADLARWLRDVELHYALNGLPLDTDHARACRIRLAEIEVLIATLQPPLRVNPFTTTTTGANP